jgi:hypothetical protein
VSDERTPRYRLICVADLPDKGATDDLDEAVVASDAHYEVYDTVRGAYVGVSLEDYEESIAQLKARGRADVES